MNIKRFLASAVAGGITDFLLGWLLYGILLTSYFPEGEDMNLLFIFLGCLTFGVFISYVWNKWAGITTFMTGLQAGAVVGLILGIYGNFFMHSNGDPNMTQFALDVVVTTIIGGAVGGVVGVVNGAIKD